MVSRTATLGLSLAVWTLVLTHAAISYAGDAQGGGQVAAHGRALAREQTLVVGRVSRSAAKYQNSLETMADWLATRLQGTPIRAGAALVVPTMKDMIDALRSGRVDLVSESVLTALTYEEQAGARLFMHEWRDGQSMYQSVFFTHRDSPIFSLRDLIGRRIAFEDRGSTSGFLMPMAALLSAGLDPARLTANDRPVPRGRVGYVFAGSEENISAWTANGLVGAGAFSIPNWGSNTTNPPAYREKLRIFFVTGPLPRSVLILRAGIDSTVTERLTRALIDYPDAPDAAGVRGVYFRNVRFTPFSGESGRALEAARVVYGLVRTKVGD